MLQELGLLFESERGGTLPNGLSDSGFNCTAKAFATMYLARLQGIEADFCQGAAVLGIKRPGSPYTCLVEPHAWVVARTKFVIDLSINHFEGIEYATVGHRPIPGVEPVGLRVAKQEADLGPWLSELPTMAGDVQLIYLGNVSRVFRLQDIALGADVLISPPTRAILFGFPTTDVLAKAILHLHQVLTGERLPLIGATQIEAWRALAAWNVDAMGELQAALSKAPRRSTPPPRAKRTGTSSCFA